VGVMGGSGAGKSTLLGILNGQRPNVDFFNPLGPLPYLLSAAGLALSGLRVEGIGYGAAMFGAVAGVWGYRLSLNRMALVPASLTGSFLVLLSTAPVPLGAGPPSLSHGMSYNRVGFVLLALILFEVLEDPVRAGKIREGGWLSGVSTGVAVGLLFLLKASYFLVGVAFVLTFYALRRRSLSGWLGVASGAAFALIPVLIWLRSGVVAMVTDQLMAGSARGQWLDFHRVALVAYRSIGEMILLLLVAMLASGWSSGTGLSRWKWPLAALTVFSAGLMLLVTNAQDADFPLSVVLLMLMVGETADSRGSSRATRFACLLAAALLMAANASLDAVSLMAAVREKHSPPAGARQFLPAHMRGLLLYDLPDPSHPLAGSNGTRYTDLINNGIELLQAKSSAGESVITLEQYNPFSYALLRKPGAGGFTFLAYGHSFTKAHKPSAERLFGGTDIVMVPKRNITAPWMYEPILRIYLPDVQRTFTLAAETPDWWMYRRRR